jgi:hypothetical protein
MLALLQRKLACVTALSFRRSHMRAGPFVVHWQVPLGGLSLMTTGPALPAEHECHQAFHIISG